MSTVWPAADIVMARLVLLFFGSTSPEPDMRPPNSIFTLAVSWPSFCAAAATRSTALPVVTVGDTPAAGAPVAGPPVAGGLGRVTAGEPEHGDERRSGDQQSAVHVGDFLPVGGTSATRPDPCVRPLRVAEAGDTFVAL